MVHKNSSQISHVSTPVLSVVWDNFAPYISGHQYLQFQTGSSAG